MVIKKPKESYTHNGESRNLPCFSKYCPHVNLKKNLI